MSNYQCVYENKAYTLLAENCLDIYNDELKPVEVITVESILEMLIGSTEVLVTKEYYQDKCEVCPPVQREKKELIPYLELHFFLFTKNQKPVMTNIAPEFEGKTFDSLYKAGLVDDSYIVSLVICPECSKYQIQIDQVDM